MVKETASIIGTLVSSETGLPNDLLPEEVRQLVLEAGYDPGEVVQEIADWCARRLTPVSEAAGARVRYPTATSSVPDAPPRGMFSGA